MLLSNGMSRSPSFSSIASCNSHRSVFKHETILKLGLDNVLKTINSVHKDTDEGFTPVKLKKT